MDRKRKGRPVKTQKIFHAECPVCQCLYNIEEKLTPINLDCNHIICLDCATEMQKKKVRKTVVDCPTYRKETRVTKSRPLESRKAHDHLSLLAELPTQNDQSGDAVIRHIHALNDEGEESEGDQVIVAVDASTPESQKTVDWEANPPADQDESRSQGKDQDRADVGGVSSLGATEELLRFYTNSIRTQHGHSIFWPIDAAPLSPHADGLPDPSKITVVAFSIQLVQPIDNTVPEKTEIAVKFNYNAPFIEYFKKMLSHRPKWDPPSRTWFVPILSLCELKAVINAVKLDAVSSIGVARELKKITKYAEANFAKGRIHDPLADNECRVQFYPISPPKPGTGTGGPPKAKTVKSRSKRRNNSDEDDAHDVSDPKNFHGHVIFTVSGGLWHVFAPIREMMLNNSNNNTNDAALMVPIDDYAYDVTLSGSFYLYAILRDVFEKYAHADSASASGDQTGTGTGTNSNIPAVVDAFINKCGIQVDGQNGQIGRKDDDGQMLWINHRHCSSDGGDSARFIAFIKTLGGHLEYKYNSKYNVPALPLSLAPPIGMVLQPVVPISATTTTTTTLNTTAASASAPNVTIGTGGERACSETASQEQVGSASAMVFTGLGAGPATQPTQTPYPFSPDFSPLSDAEKMRIEENKRKAKERLLARKRSGINMQNRFIGSMMGATAGATASQGGVGVGGSGVVSTGIAGMEMDLTQLYSQPHSQSQSQSQHVFGSQDSHM